MRITFPIIGVAIGSIAFALSRNDDSAANDVRSENQPAPVEEVEIIETIIEPALLTEPEDGGDAIIHGCRNIAPPVLPRPLPIS